jgi:Flp pilus assembly pilin Flp
MFKAYKKFKNQKIIDVRRELARAHMIIALLAFVAIVLLIQTSALLADLNTLFTTIAIALLSVVAIMSLSIGITLFSITKK